MKKKISSIILIILTILIFYYLVKDNYNEIFLSLLHVKFIWIFVVFILYIFHLIFQAIPFYMFSKVYNKDIKFGFLFYLMVVSNFFNGITPLASGGQPFQIYEIHKKDISLVNATNVVLENSIAFQFAVILWGVISYIINIIFHLVEIPLLLNHLIFVGFFLNSLLLFIVILISLNKYLVISIIDFFINIGYRLHLVKDLDKSKEKWNSKCDEFHENSKMIWKNKKLLFLSILSIFISYIFYYFIPLFIMLSLNMTISIPVITILIFGSFIFLSSSYLPIPGASGGVEYSFIHFFGLFIFDYKLNTLLLLWRFLTYYLPMILGGIIFDINSLKKK